MENVLWNAVFAADMVASFREHAARGDVNRAIDLIPGTIEDAEFLANEIVIQYEKYKEKKKR